MSDRHLREKLDTDGESIFKVGESDDVLDEVVTVDLYLNQGRHSTESMPEWNIGLLKVSSPIRV